MPAPSVPTPHASLFHKVFSRRKLAAQHLRGVLPPALVAAVDWRTLRVESGHFVDDALAWSASDLLYSVKLGGERLLVYVLLEHQSRSDPLMVFRVLRYMVRVWEKFLAEHPDAKTLPVIVPVLLSHAEGGWKAAVTMHELLGLEGERAVLLGAFAPSFRLLLDDVGAQSDAELRGRTLDALGALALLLFRHGRDPDGLLDRWAEWAELWRKLWSLAGGRKAVGLLAWYSMLVNPRVTREDAATALGGILGPGAREVVMTEGERLIQLGEVRGEARGEARGERKGLKRGLRKGRVEGRREALLTLLAARGLAVSPALRARVEACVELPCLDGWIVRAATAQSADEALSGT